MQGAPGKTEQFAKAFAGLSTPLLHVTVVATEEHNDPNGTVDAVNAATLAPLAKVWPLKVQGAGGVTAQIATAFGGLNTPLVHVTVVATDEQSEPNGTVAAVNAGAVAPVASV